MSGNVPACFPPQIFSVVRYKSLDYVFEATTSFKVMMNLLALPTPYLANTLDLYPHSGKVPEVTYRTPWIRGKVISTCKLFVSGSVLEDLKVTSLHSLERFNITLKRVRSDVEDILTSDPHSVNTEQDEDVCNSESQLSDLCPEHFCKWTMAQMYPETQSKFNYADLLLPEDLMVVDYLSQFKSHLPTLTAKLSRLKPLPVVNPLLSLIGDSITEDSIFRHCAAFEKTSDMYTRVNQTCGNIVEEFCKETLMKEESLFLPEVVDTFKMTTANCMAFSRTHGCIDVAPVLLEEQPPVLDVLQQNVSVAVDIAEFDVTVDRSEEYKMEGGLTNPDSIEHQMLPLEMELDLNLTPTDKTSHSHLSLSTLELRNEEFSPQRRQSLLLSGALEEMERAQWKAEKHPTFVVGFLLAELQTCEAAAEFQPLSEALKCIKSESHIFMNAAGGELQSQTMTTQVYKESSSEFPERMDAGLPTSEVKMNEDFEILSPDHSLFTVRSVQMSPTNKTALTLPKKLKVAAEEVKAPTYNLLQREIPNETSQNALLKCTISTNKEAPKPAAATCNIAHKPRVKFSEAPAISSACKNNTNTDNAEHCTRSLEQSVSSVRNMSENHRHQMNTRQPEEKCLDLISSFMTLRSQQTSPESAGPQSSTSSPATTTGHKTQMSEVKHPPEQMQISKRQPYLGGAISGTATRVQETTGQRRVVSHPVSQSNPKDRPDSKVIQVTATESQLCAYCELLAIARPCLNSVRELGLKLPVGGDFSCLLPNQTHFLLKQQEKALNRVQEPQLESVTDQGLLFRQTALIHVLVMSKELLQKCNLSTALAYLTKAMEVCLEPSLEKLAKRLQIILFLSCNNNNNQEPDVKLQELQQLLSAWLNSRDGKNNREKILVLLSVDSDEDRSVIINSLSQVAGAVVMALRPEGKKAKLNGASVVSSVYNSVCAVVYEQHIGPDFPWNSFCLVVEYNQPGQSPWSTVCRERNINHVTFDTSISQTEKVKCLEDKVPYVLLMTEVPHNCQLLLQILESEFNITVLERSHCPSLQMLGGAQHYAVVTVDESTAIIIQEQDELHQERAREGLVIRLTALSLQYSCCWLILHCPDIQGGGFSGEAFSNLVLVYSSLVLFGMKSMDLQVKVLIVSEVLEIAKWIHRVCFHSLMSSVRDPVSYLSRDWLSLSLSQEEMYLLQFPCINPMVSQLMLRKALSLKWLLRATLPQLTELLPEVPHKVLKLFTDSTALCTLTTLSNQPESQKVFAETNQQTFHPHPSYISPHSEPSHHNTSVLFGPESSFCGQVLKAQRENTDLSLNSSSFGSSNLFHQSNISSAELCGNEVSLSGWRSRSGAVGRVIRRENDEWTLRSTPYLNEHSSCLDTVDDSPFKLDPTFRYSPVLLHQPEENTQMSTSSEELSDFQHPNKHNLTCDLSPGTGVTLLGRVESSNICPSNSVRFMTTTPKYGSKCWIGHEKKRSGEAAGMFGPVLTPLKKGRLSYEKVPGRSDGQTRLKLF